MTQTLSGGDIKLFLAYLVDALENNGDATLLLSQAAEQAHISISSAK
jgi:hypothetical protein